MKYTYICPDCNKERIIEQSIMEDLPKKVKCPKCEKKGMIYSPTNFTSDIRIPFNMRAESGLETRYHKSGKVHKKFY